jgi:hypothetical protein
MIEREIGQKIGTLHANHSGEFTSNEFAKYYQQQRIQRQFTQAFILQQNRVAERPNKMIMEQARNMILHCKLPGYLWNEAVNIANFLVNCSPTFANQGMTPEEKY